METSCKIGIYSEVGTLKRVLVHTPGKEIENITPDLMQRLLFDEIPYLKIAREEHNAFVNVFQQNGTEVIELTDAIAEIIKDPSIKEDFIDKFIRETLIRGEGKKHAVKDFLLQLSDEKILIEKMITGIFKKEIEVSEILSFADVVNDDYPFITDPMPNLYFTRDPAAVIGKGKSINCMNTAIRKRESLFTDYLFRYHKSFAGHEIPTYYKREETYSIEGGDILVLSDKVILIGISERTDVLAIETFANTLLASDEPFDTILALNIPNKRAFMHLDTVFTMLDRNSFTIHNEIRGTLKIYAIKKRDGRLVYSEESGSLKEVLQKHLKVDCIRLIKCGGGDSIIAPREQWNDGANTLAIAPGEVIVYERNYVTNTILEDAGIKLHKIPSSELSRGRGGPRCMSMPILRDK
ncbi:MAG: arginine deiminase [Bacillota bacterium]|nr:arginine deiminase [Bacillota bacterium]